MIILQNETKLTTTQNFQGHQKYGKCEKLFSPEEIKMTYLLDVHQQKAKRKQNLKVWKILRLSICHGLEKSQGCGWTMVCWRDQACGSWINHLSRSQEQRCGSPAKICGGPSGLMAWTPMNCLGGQQGLWEFYTSTASLHWRGKDGKKMKKGCQDSTGVKWVSRANWLWTSVIFQEKGRMTPTADKSPVGLSLPPWA